MVPPKPRPQVDWLSGLPDDAPLRDRGLVAAAILRKAQEALGVPLRYVWSNECWAELERLDGSAVVYGYHWVQDALRDVPSMTVRQARTPSAYEAWG